MLHLRFALLPLLLAGCYSPSIPNGSQKCAAGNLCAAGYECGADGLCYKKGQLPNIGPDMAVSVDMTIQCSQADCKAPTPICDPDSKQCVPCLTDTHCPDGKLCKNKQCVAGCSMAHGCGDAGMCDPNGMCKICKVDGDCGGNTPRCDTDSGRCVACLPQMGQVADNCTNGEFCKKVNSDYTCVKGCKIDGDCMGGKCCNNVCVDLQTDGMNCGVCGKTCMGGACCAGACTDTASDIANCGMCGKTCTGGHAMWSCMMGGCNITGCQGSYKDCNMDPMDGCEANTAADANNCTACGMKCNLQNAVAGCANGCFVQSCNMGFGNCDNMAANGCEANVAIDKNNCGMCGKVCGNVPNGFPGCANSMCIIGGCINGYDDCDMQVPNGCEAKVDADPNNCGGCGMKCPAPANASASCAANVCGLGMCNAGFANCDNMAGNGCEKNVNSDAANCGGCGKVCSNANIGNPTCGNGVCNGNCTAGFADCDNNKQTNGCEVNTTNDKNNCGMCAKVCMNQCVNSVCGAIDLTGVFNQYNQDGRTVYIWKTPMCANLANYTTFCQGHGLNWWKPKSQADAQALITNAYNLDMTHTWIQVYGTVTSTIGNQATLNGFNVTVDSPTCVEASNGGWAAFRKWGCSICNPQSMAGNQFGQSCCWDKSHPYDWFVCE